MCQKPLSSSPAGPRSPPRWRACDYQRFIRPKPGELPLQSAEKFELAFNLKTAKALNVTISEAFLLRADEVIE